MFNEVQSNTLSWIKTSENGSVPDLSFEKILLKDVNLQIPPGLQLQPEYRPDVLFCSLIEIFKTVGLESHATKDLVVLCWEGIVENNGKGT